MDLFKNKKLWMPDMLEEGFARGGDRVFTIFQRADGTRDETSFSAVKEEGDKLITTLKSAGLQKGDRIAVVCAMRPWWYSLLYACLKGGYRMVCIDPGVPLSQIHSMMRRTEVRAVVTTLPGLTLPAVLKNRIPVYALERGFPLMTETRRVDKLLNSAFSMPEDTFFILFSSGTTKETRKGVLLPHTSVTEAITGGMSEDTGVYGCLRPYSVRKRDLLMFPPYHIAGLLCAVLDIYCCTQVIMLERLTPNGLSSALKELQPDNISTVPAVLTTLMKKMKAGLKKHKLLNWLTNGLLGISGFLRRYLGINIGRGLIGYVNRMALGGKMAGMMIGGSPCDAETMKFFLNMGIDVALAYGLTELGAPLAVTGRGYYPGTTGRIMAHDPMMDIRIMRPDEHGHGEVEVRSPYRMITYLDAGDNEGCFTEDGYFKTGDIGYFDNRRCLVICGRAKEAIVLRNGEKLLPEEIEAHYQGLKDVAELAVFRLPDEGGCDTFGIAATKETEKKALPDELLKLHILDRAAELGGNLVPKEVYVLHSMPYSSSHKIQRFRLTEMALAGKDAPTTDDMFRSIEEDGVVAELRQLLVNAGGTQWKTAELTEGTLLNLDSLQMMELLIAVQEHFGLDLFCLSKAPESFGELLEAVNHYDTAEKRDAQTLDLSQYPMPVSKSEKALFVSLKRVVKLRWHVHANGLENIPEEGNFIFCANHQTALDPGFIVCDIPAAISDHMAIVGKRDVVEDKTLKIFAHGQHMVPIDRGGNAIPTLERCSELLLQGWHILIFPEGTNYENAEGMLKFKEGPARMAISTGKSMIPVHIKGAARVDSNIHELLPPVSKRVDVVFGAPISPEGKTVEELNAALRAAIEAL